MYPFFRAAVQYIDSVTVSRSLYIVLLIKIKVTSQIAYIVNGRISN